MERIVLQERQRLLREGLALFIGAEPDIEVVATAETGKELLDVCAETRPSAVLLELDVADWDACRVAALLKRRQRSIRIVGTCARPLRNETIRAALVGVRTVVSRSAGIRPLVDALRSEPAEVRHLPLPTTTRAPAGSLTRRELEILAHVASGATTREASERLGISPKTVENHKQRIFAKLDVQNQAHAVAVAMRGGLLPPDVAFSGSAS